MNSENLVRNLRLLLRADKIIADIRLRQMLSSLGLMAFAALISAFGLLMLELAAYFALVNVVNAIVAAAVLGIVNFVIALVLAVIASRRRPSPELTLAHEVHDTAIEALQIEAQAVQSQINRMLHHPLEGILPLLVPLITAAISHLRRPSAATD